ncbi:hypothetical protein C7M84_012938 [Penaeus vannamei]|uniref:Uncharacterized protein n=1 Tax=Penaeus vannamei TaxID=6689 RepID=A0A3R7MSQ2_PENVA|nr:hypothetical protein C7M84_012938 [Penaeus vannamei]
MPGDVSHHRLIARPPGLPGYQPGRWCAVCGKTTSNRTIIDCSSGDCPNTSHTNCLGDNSTFDCCEVSALRTAQGITSPVVYQVAAAEPPEGALLSMLSLLMRERKTSSEKYRLSRHKTTLYLFKVSVDSFLLLLIPLVLPYPSLSPVTGLQDIRHTHHTHNRSTPLTPTHTLSSRLTPFIQPGVMPGRKSRDQLTIISANVRGLLTNIGDLVIPRTPDIVATVETFMNESVPDNFGHMKGYTRWHRRDRTHGTFGGVAVSFHKSLSVQPLDVDPNHLEIMFFKIWAQHQTVLLCVCYRPQWQGSEPIVFLQTHLDELLQLHTCNHVIIGICTLYAAQVRSLMEYAPLTWSSCPPSYLGLLDKIQQRAQRLICLKAPPDQSSPLMQPLQQPPAHAPALPPPGMTNSSPSFPRYTRMWEPPSTADSASPHHLITHL